MSNPLKSVWLAVVLVAAGVVIFYLSFGQKQEQPQGVVLQEIFNQKPAAANGGQFPAGMSAPAQVPAAEAKSADPVKAPAIVTDPDHGHEAAYAVQVYSFQDKARAERALENLKSSGYKAFLVVSDLGEKGIWYRVRVGGLADEQAARAMLDDVRKNYKSGFIVKPKA